MYSLLLNTCTLSAPVDGVVSEVLPHVRQTTPWRQRGGHNRHSKRSGRYNSDAGSFESIKAIFASLLGDRRCTP
ncbi:hypothetical protein AWB69_06077 [Caballeronia udeis]|uniref:Uncharacterized protein n=1 Tax=Caballeronia udeis TaxID=1232866 RepID=A0A158II63_9BURK|nr:hypothetical protein AWB69_06077 [Caballeronia udeis]